MARNAVSKAINHIKKRIKMRNISPKFWQRIRRIERARQEGERRDDVAGDCRHVIECLRNNPTQNTEHR